MWVCLDGFLWVCLRGFDVFFGGVVVHLISSSEGHKECFLSFVGEFPEAQE